MQTKTRALTVALAAGLAAPALAQTDIFWNAGSGNWNDVANWNPMNVPNSPSENAFILAPAFAEVALDITASIGTLEVGPQIMLTIEPARTLGLSGAITNNGLIDVNPTTSVSNAAVQFNANTSIVGSGVLRLSGGGDDARLLTNGTTLTNGAGHTIDGAGQITASLINEGVVTALDTGFANRLELISSTKTNNSNMQAGDGAELFISGITINQAPGATIAANAGGIVIFNGNNTINGGRLVGPGAFIKPTSGNLSLSDVSLEQDFTVDPGAGVLYNSPAFNCTGRITLNDTSSVSNSFIQFNNNTIVSGGGSIFLAGGGNDSQVTTNGTTVTLAPGFTIEGSGDVPATLVNNGLIRAFPSDNGDGRLRLFSGAKTNNALIRADSGGIVEINSIVVTQDAGALILADGGTVEFVSNQTVNGGTIRAINGGTLIKPPSGNLSLGGVSLQGDLDVAGGAGVLYNTDAFDCQGTIVLNDSGAAGNAFIQFNNNTTVSGGGTFFLAGSGNDSQVTTNGTTVTLEPGFTIEGSGEIPATLVNNGLIRAFPSTNGDGELRLFSGTKTNNAQIRADAGGIVELSGVTVNQGPAGEILADGGTVEFVSNQTVNGGTIRAINGGTLTKPPSGNLSLSDIFLDADLDVAGGAGVLYNSPLLTATGSINLNDSGAAGNALMQFNANTTATGGGRIFLGGSADDSQVTTNGTVLTIAPDFAIEGSGFVPAALINNGLIRAFPSTDGDGRITLFSGAKTNNSQIVADPGGVIDITGVVITQGPAGEILADGGTVEFVSNQTVNGGTIRAVNGGRLVKTAGGNLSIGGDLTLASDFELEGAAGMQINAATLTNEATVRINSNGTAGNAVIQFNGNTVVVGAGRMLLEGGGDNSQLNTNGTTVTHGPEQIIEGEGQMNGSHIVLGTMMPGLPLGAITGNASITFGADAELIADVDGNGSGDSINVSGVVTPAGAVSIQIDPGYTPAIDDEFTLITAGSVSGEFAGVAVTSGVLPPDVAVRLDHQANQVDVNFVCLADLLAPFGVLDLIDINAFVQAFLNQQPAADLAAPIGVWDLSDIGTFITAFNTTCQ